eukprot:9174335-Prorocentrum_lima.AAC.1
MMITARSLTASCWTRGIAISAAKSACVRHVGGSSTAPCPHTRLLGPKGFYGGNHPWARYSKL